MTGEHLKKSGSVYMDVFTTFRNAQIDPRTGYYEFPNISRGAYKIWTSVLDFEEDFKNVEVGDEDEIRIDFHISEKEEEEVPWG
jgi:hypothetical protein